MKIGTPKETKIHEYRVGLTPSSVKELSMAGHNIFIQKDAGAGIGYTDKMYESAGAKILETAKEIFDTADMIVKVKEPLESEYKLLRENQILFTYLHLAPDPIQAKGLIDSKCVAIAYETVTDNNNGLPLLAPMSEVAGRMSIQVGARFLEKEQGGSGVLLGGVPGVSPGHVVILGGGVVGTNAARMAVGMGSRVTIIDRSIKRLKELDDLFQSRVETLYSTQFNIEKSIQTADVIVGGVLIPGGSAPKLITKDMLKLIPQGSVMVDVAIDQGGCFETSKPTSHKDPIYIEEGIIHYCVTNMPGAVARTSAQALNNATLPYVLKIANQGYREALLNDQHLMNGLNVMHGSLTHMLVAQDLQMGSLYQLPQILLA
jgi:alanine dehydrogenase